MSFGFGFGFPSWRTLAGGFSPAALFVGGVQGAWYDPSDLSTMFTTSDGTTPVAMPGQGTPVSVGLMLDKSQGLVLGPELVTNGGPFANTTGWTGSANCVLSTASSRLIATYSFSNTFYQAITVEAGKTYFATVTLKRDSGVGTAFINFRNGTTLASSILGNSSAGTSSATDVILAANYFAASSGTVYLHIPCSTTGSAVISIASVSTKTIPGNHAIAFNNTTARPELRARVNLLTYSEQFDNGAWTKSATTITANAIANPLNGAVDADLVIATAVLGFHYVRQIPTVSASSYIFSAYVKAGGYNYVEFHIDDSGGQKINVIVNLTNGVANNIVGTSTVTALANGWYYVTTQGTTTSAITLAQFNVANNASGTNFTGNGTSGIYIWGADLRPANIGANVPAYQRIADANTYDTNGFPLYLRFDGIDDSMYTPANLNLSGTDKVSVFAGVRKLSDAAQGVVAELSATIASNNGTFLLAAPDGATQTYGWDSKGTTQVDAVASSLAAPRTNVLVGTADIAGDSCIIRVNGAVADTEAGDQGTGNFGTYPLYIGARNNSSLRFNGHLHSLIIAGSAVSAGNISATEQWVAGKTGLVLVPPAPPAGTFDVLPSSGSPTYTVTSNVRDSSGVVFAVSSTVLSSSGTSYSPI